MITFICYEKCTTCRKAKAFLDQHGIAYTMRAIKEDNPTYDELRAWHAMSGADIKKFFNTSGLLYKSLSLKDKLPAMTDDDKLRLLSSDGMLVKRPLLVGDDFVLTGFNESVWAQKLNIE